MYPLSIYALCMHDLMACDVRVNKVALNVKVRVLIRFTDFTICPSTYISDHKQLQGHAVTSLVLLKIFLIYSLCCQCRPCAVAFASNGKLMALAYRNVFLWDITKEAVSCTSHIQNVHILSVSIVIYLVTF